MIRFQYQVSILLKQLKSNVCLVQDFDQIFPPSETNQIIKTLRERRDAEREVESSNNNPYLQAIRSLSLRDGTALLSYKTPLNSIGNIEPSRPNLIYPSKMFQKPFWSMVRENSNEAKGIKNFSSSDLLCRKLRMC